MSSYTPTGTTVEVLDNPRIISNQESARLPAIIGLGPVTRSVVDEAVVRGSGSVDSLAAYPGAGVSVTQIAKIPGILANTMAAVAVSDGGQLYAPASASVSTAGQLTWTGSGENVPAVNAVYYVTYNYDVPAAQFIPYTTGDKALIKARYGTENTTNGLLAIAGNLALENNAPQVILVQASGSAYNEANYKAAIDKLRKKDNVEQIVVVFPSGSVTRAQQQTLLTYAYSHVLAMNAKKKERGMVSGSPSVDYTADGFDSIGDLSTPASYLYRAHALKSADMTYVVPSVLTRVDESGNTMQLDGNFAAVAVAAVQSAQSKRSTPITGFVVTGISIEDEKWEDTDMDVLGAGGCLVLQSKGGIITIRDAITTDGTSADTQEMSVRASRRLVQRSLRNGLDNQFTNKGLTILPETPSNVSAGTRAILEGLVQDGEIFAYGKTNDPTTGETAISSVQDSIEPRRINTTCSVKYLYPLKWIQVTVSTFV